MCTVKKSVDILCDALVKVYSFIFPTDFVIFDFEVNFNVFIILGSTFLVMGKALVDMEMGYMKLYLNDK